MASCAETCPPSPTAPFTTKLIFKMLRASCLTLEINEFRCYEAKIQENEKAGSHRESNPVCNWGTQYNLCSTYRGLWGLVVVLLFWLNGRALVAQARCPGFDSQWMLAFSLSSIFCLITSKFIYLVSKWIALTDNLWPKSDDAKWYH